MRVAPLVLLCLVLVSVIYGFSVTLSTSLNFQTLEKDDYADAHTTYYQVLAYMPHYHNPKGDPINNPKPN